jgi:hypothetical protein
MGLNGGSAGIVQQVLCGFCWEWGTSVWLAGKFGEVER